MIHIWHWILDFVGVNNTYDVFSTKMYNFWSGFGGGIIQFSLLGAIVAIYRHYVTRAKALEAALKKPLTIIEERVEVKREEKHKD